jgi:hypothetical protein
MKNIAFYMLITVALAAGVSAQVKTQAAQNQKFAAALEAQVSCIEKVEPVKAIRALQRAGIISKNPHIVIDSVSYFKVRRPLTVLGYKVESVSGYDEESKIFKRGPGTSPGIQLGIVVASPIEEVKLKLKGLDLQNVMINESDIDPVRTQITCPGER